MIKHLLLGSALVLASGGVLLAQTVRAPIAIESSSPRSPAERAVAQLLRGEMGSRGLRIGGRSITLGQSGVQIQTRATQYGRFDLNGDDIPEIFVVLVDTEHAAGGAGGLEHRIYVAGTPPVPIFAFNANQIEADCSRRSERFCDLIVDRESRISYSNGQYRPQRSR